MTRILSVFLFCLGIFCLAQSNAQVPMTGAGLGTSGPSKGPLSVTELASNDVGNGASLTTGADTPVGGCNVVVVDTHFAPENFTSVVDTATGGSNTYTKAVSVQEGVGSVPSAVGIFYTSGGSTHDLPNGGTITVNTDNNTRSVIAAYTITNAFCTLDKINSTVAVSGATFSLASGTLTSVKEVVFTGFNTTTNTVSLLVESSGFTTNTFSSNAANFLGLGNDAAYKIVSATTSVVYTPSWTGSAVPGAVIATFK